MVGRPGAAQVHKTGGLGGAEVWDSHQQHCLVFGGLQRSQVGAHLRFWVSPVSKESHKR